MIGIRADANKTIATGHIMRCMTIADAIVELGEEVIFFVADEESAQWPKSRGFSYELLDSDWANPIGELDTLVTRMSEREVRILLCDSYSFNTEYYSLLREKTNSEIKLVCMDDLGKEVYPVDILINYNAYAKTLGYEDKYDESVSLLLGPMYAPLRVQFAKSYSRESYGQKQVLIASGGGDSYGVCLALMEELAQRKTLEDIDFHIVIGNQADGDKIARLAWCCHNVFLHKGVEEMARLMSDCDVAISAAGTMLTELCAMKVPAIEYVMADNQQQNSDYYSEQGIMIYGGDVRQDLGVVAKNIIDELEKLIEDKARLSAMRSKMTGICDGCGASRLAKEILMG